MALLGERPVREEASRVLVIPVGECLPQALTTAAAFRAAGSRTAVDTGKRKLKKTLAAANTKGIRYIILIGESEAAEGKIRLKDMLQQSEELLTVEAAIAVISK